MKLIVYRYKEGKWYSEAGIAGAQGHARKKDVEAIQIDSEDLVTKFMGASGNPNGFDPKKIPIAIAILMTILTDFCDKDNAEALYEFAQTDFGVSSHKHYNNLQLRI